VDHQLRFHLFKQVVQHFGVTKIPLKEPKPLIFKGLLQIVAFKPGIVETIEVVETGYFVSFIQKPIYQMRPNETSPSGNQNTHAILVSLVCTPDLPEVLMTGLDVQIITLVVMLRNKQ
jgi:hypothetical protein